MRIRNPIARWRQRQLLDDLAPQVASVEAYLEGLEPRAGDRGRPVLFFNASTRIHTLSLNAAFGLLASWAVRAAGIEARYLVCHAGMLPCVLGTDRNQPEASPPCAACLDLSRTLFTDAQTLPLELDRPQAAGWRRELQETTLDSLVELEHGGLPLGKLTLPSVRWILRRHRLADSWRVRSLMAGYIVSAAGLADTVRAYLSSLRPRALVVFNGVFYPEAVARRVARDLDIPVVTHEVGLRPFSAFFSHQDATFRDVELPQDFVLTSAQEAELDDVLERRFRGDFTMAGVRFWRSMEGLPAPLLEKRKGFRQAVTVFTNVVFDTSQIHANVLFDDMFAWLDDLVPILRRQTDTLFIIRAHPDETRRGKESQETVAAWVHESSVDRMENVVFVAPDEPVSSYDLIKASKFVLVYNSSVGLEASILGKAVLSAGRARFTQVEATYVPSSRNEYSRLLGEFLAAESVPVPEVHVRNARAFLYYELFRASLDLGEFLAPDPRLPGMVRFSRFQPSRLADADVLTAVRQGIVEGKPFVTTPAATSPDRAGEEHLRGAPISEARTPTRGDA